MRNLIIATALFFILFGFIGGYAVRAATAPVVRVTTQQVHVTTQEVHVDEIFCHIEGELRDPGVTYTFSQDIVCSAIPIEMRRR